VIADDVKIAATKVGIAWAGAFAGWGLTDWATFMALLASGLAAVFTILQIYVLARDKLFKK
jgi:hypothetical protein